MGEMTEVLAANRATEDEVSQKQKVLEERDWLEEDVEKIMSKVLCLAEGAENIEEGGYEDFLANFIIRLHKEIEIKRKGIEDVKD